MGWFTVHPEMCIRFNTLKGPISLCLLLLNSEVLILLYSSAFSYLCIAVHCLYFASSVTLHYLMIVISDHQVKAMRIKQVIFCISTGFCWA